MRGLMAISARSIPNNPNDSTVTRPFATASFAGFKEDELCSILLRIFFP